MRLALAQADVVVAACGRVETALRANGAKPAALDKGAPCAASVVAGPITGRTLRIDGRTGATPDRLDGSATRLFPKDESQGGDA